MRAVGALVLLCGCTSIFGLESPQRAPGDGAPADDVVVVDSATMLHDAAPDAPLGPWANVTQVITSGEADDDPTATGDRRELYFNRSGGIFRSLRATTADAWGTPAIVNELSSTAVDSRPQVSADGLTMLLSSARGGSNGSDLWWSTRMSRSLPWEAPVRLDKINSGADEIAGSLTTDRLETVYAADRMTNGDFDLYYTVRASDDLDFERGIKLAFNTTGTETSPFLTGDGQTLYMTIAVTGSGTMADIYVSHRLSASTWTAPEVITELRTAEPDSDPWVSPDGRHMMFARFAGGRFQIFEASR